MPKEREEIRLFLGGIVSPILKQAFPLSSRAVFARTILKVFLIHRGSARAKSNAVVKPNVLSFFDHRGPIPQTS